MILAMARLEAAMLKEVLPAVLGALHGAGVVHLEPPRDLPPDAAGPLTRLRLSAEDEQQRGELQVIADSSADILGTIDAKADPDLLRRLEAADHAEISACFKETAETLRQLDRHVGDLKEELRVLPHYNRLIDAFLSITYALDRRADWAMVGLILDRSRAADVETLRHEIARATRGRMEISLATLDAERIAAIVFYDRQFEADLERLIWGRGIEHLKLPPAYLGRPLEEVLADISRRLHELPAAIAAAEAASRRALAEHGSRLAALGEIARHRRAELLAKGLCLQSPHAVLLAGWVPRDRTAELRRLLRERFGDAVLVKFRPPRRDELSSVPVALSNPRPTRPFELLLAPLQTPRYGSLDPTLSLALFFPLFFGVMVGDIGHGTLIVLAALALRRWAKRVPKAVSTILLTMGGSAIAFGFAFGELFGNLGEGWLHPLLFGRREGIVPLLILALSIGGVHVALGFVLGIAGALRLRDARRATQRAATLALLVGGMLLLGAAARWLPPGWLTPGLVLMLTMVPVLLYAGGFIAVLELLSTAAHILSYARLMALGLAGAMLAQVANRLGSAIDNVVLGVVVAVLLHLLHLVMNLFSPTVQALRLNYVEFFSKFYEPGGVPYTPFRKEAGHRT